MSQSLKWEAISAILLVCTVHPVLPKNDTNLLGLPINVLDGGLSEALARLLNQVDVTTSTTSQLDSIVSQSSNNNALVSFFQTKDSLHQNGNSTTPQANEPGSRSSEDALSAAYTGSSLGEISSPLATPQTTEFSPNEVTKNKAVNNTRNSADVKDGVTSLPSSAYDKSTEFYRDSALTPQPQDEVFTSTKSSFANPNLNLTSFDVILQLLRNSFTSLGTTDAPGVTTTTTAKSVIVETDLQSILKGLLNQNEAKLSSNQSTLLTTTTSAPETSPVIDSEITTKDNYVKDIVDGIVKVLNKPTDSTPTYVTSPIRTSTVPESSFVSDAPKAKEESYIKDIVDGIVNVLSKNTGTTPLAPSFQTSKYASSTTFTAPVAEPTFERTAGSTRSSNESRISTFANQSTTKPPLSQNQVLDILGNLFKVSLSSTASDTVQTTKAPPTTAAIATSSEAALQKSVINNILDQLVNVPQSTMISSAMLTSKESMVSSSVDPTSSSGSTPDFGSRGERTEKSVSRGATLAPLSVMGIALMILTPALSETPYS